METRGNYILVGAIVMIAIAAGFLVVLNLSNQRTEFDEYDIQFTERVSGLSVGAQVRFNGIQKGEVATLTIDPENPAIVVARIRVGKDTPVKEDTRAELEPVGFTGLTIIQLVGGSADVELLRDASDRKVPLIVADTSGIGALFEGSGDLIAQASKILSDQNIKQFSDIITHIEVVTGRIAENDEEIGNILVNLDTASADVVELTKTLQAAALKIDTLVSEDGAEAAEEINLLVKDLRVLVADNEGSIQSFTDEGLGQVAPAVTEFRRLMRNVDNILTELDRDPKAYFLGGGEPEYEAGDEK